MIDDPVMFYDISDMLDNKDNSCLFYATKDMRYIVLRDCSNYILWQISPSYSYAIKLYRISDDNIDYNKQFKSKEEFFDLMLKLYPDYLDWLLFNPGYL